MAATLAERMADVKAEPTVADWAYKRAARKAGLLGLHSAALWARLRADQTAYCWAAGLVARLVAKKVSWKAAVWAGHWVARSAAKTAGQMAERWVETSGAV
jgi:hypothetical protein